mmetsp:Transcript_9617/g.28250  ORF Transcript_9617/g.28250 Transcript_9617/m.28250 type:complete len:279 (-) Transcript_9617:245-1081(-)
MMLRLRAPVLLLIASATAWRAPPRMAAPASRRELVQGIPAVVALGAAALGGRPAGAGAKEIATEEPPPMIDSWGQPWSKAGARVGPVDALVYPAWLQGTWTANATMDQIAFPIGRQFITDATPGVRMASLLPLPNVGNNPVFTLNFPGEKGGAVADRAFNAQSTLEGFWPAANVTKVEIPSADYLKLTYVAPTRSMKDFEQHVELTTLFEEVGEKTPGTFAWSQVFTQNNVEQAKQGTFKVRTPCSAIATSSPTLPRRSNPPSPVSFSRRCGGRSART